MNERGLSAPLVGDDCAEGVRRMRNRLAVTAAALSVVAVPAAALSVTAVPAAAHANVMVNRASKSSVVVQIVTRAPFGQMFATVKGKSLYTDPSGPCTGGCLTIWPPLLMARGKTTPQGVSGLGTVKFRHRLQVTYNGQALYTFASDSGTSVNGNGVGGFAVATVG